MLPGALQTFQNNNFLAPRCNEKFKNTQLINKRYPSCSQMYSTVQKYSEYSKTIIPLLQSALNSSQVFKKEIFFLLGALLKQFKNILRISQNNQNSQLIKSITIIKCSQIMIQQNTCQNIQGNDFLSPPPGALNSSKQLPPGRQESRHNKGNLPLGEHQEEI